jgi:ring-1,2-phenylacetyl-CoA epoxidase subunit PaaC
MSEQASLIEFLTALADDELLLGHRDSEWTGHAPILEEDIAFSNIAQDEIGHSLVWYSMLEPLSGRTPDHMGFVRSAAEFRCCRFVTYPKGDFAYTVVRQYLFDEAELVRLEALGASSYAPIRAAAGKILQEEAYHVLHSKGLLERLGTATSESRTRMQAAVDAAFPQALGMFELLGSEDDLVRAGVFPGNKDLQRQWLQRIVPVMKGAELALPVDRNGEPTCAPDLGGRRGFHLPHLDEAVADMQKVYLSEPGAAW